MSKITDDWELPEDTFEHSLAVQSRNGRKGLRAADAAGRTRKAMLNKLLRSKGKAPISLPSANSDGD